MVGKVFNDLSLLVFPLLLIKNIMLVKSLCLRKLLKKKELPFPLKKSTHFSSVFGNFVLAVTSHSFTVQSADPEARSEPSPLNMKDNSLDRFLDPENYAKRTKR